MQCAKYPPPLHNSCKAALAMQFSNFKKKHFGFPQKTCNDNWPLAKKSEKSRTPSASCMSKSGGGKKRGENQLMANKMYNEKKPVFFMQIRCCQSIFVRFLKKIAYYHKKKDPNERRMAGTPKTCPGLSRKGLRGAPRPGGKTDGLSTNRVEWYHTQPHYHT